MRDPNRRRPRAIAIPQTRSLLDDFTDWMVGEGRFWIGPLLLALAAAMAWAATRDQGLAFSY